MSKLNYTTNRALAQVAITIIGLGAIFGGIWVICRVASALLSWAGVA